MFVDQFAPEAVHDRARIALSRKVEVVHDGAISALGSACRHKVRIDIRFGDGTIESETRKAPRGREHSFATEGEIVEKFCKLTRHAMSTTPQAALVDAVLKLEVLPDSKRSAELL